MTYRVNPMLKSTQIIKIRHSIIARLLIIARQHKPNNFAAVVISLLLIAPIAQASPFSVSEPALLQVYQQYGEQAQTRLRQWQQTINQAIGKTEIEQLKLANNFINQAQFIDSPYYQDDFDFRLSPMAFLILGAGDSEEFSIAKYFTLREMGIDSSKLRLTYTERAPSGASHMVLAYYQTADAEPLVLDYLDKAVRSISQRQDIRFIFSFGAEDIWLSQSNAKIRLSPQLARPLRDPYKLALFLYRPVATMGSTHY